MSDSQNLDPNKLIGSKIKPVQHFFTEKQAILYALTIGFNEDPLKKSDFKYTYQRDDDFQAFPTFITVLHKSQIDDLKQLKGMPESFDPYRILHATHKTQMISSRIKPNVKYITYGEVVNIQDKGKMSLLTLEFKSYEKLEKGKQDLAFINTFGMMLMSVGGFGFAGNKLTKQVPKPPKRPHDLILTASTFKNQAIFYRLSGDYNPLHIDPNASQMLGFKVPILHGLCSYGIVARTIVQNLLNNDCDRFKSFHVRFAGHVFPGQTFEIKIWRGDGLFYFITNVVQRQKICLVGALQYKQVSKI